LPETDVLVVSIGSTGGWRAAAAELADSLRRAGASVAEARARPSRRVRTFVLTDMLEALAARRAAAAAIAAHDPRAIIYCSVTAALLWPRPGAISLDSIAAENRPGRHGLWQRPVERRRLREATLLLAWSPDALAPLGAPPAPVVWVPPAVEGAASPDRSRDLAAVTYAGDAIKRRLGHVLETWSRVRRDGEVLVVAGTDAAPAAPGVEVAGVLEPVAFRRLLSRARVFIAAPRREDFGIAPLEALAQGCLLVSTPAPGPYPALALARELDARLVDEDLARAVRTALDHPLAGYAERAAALLAPFRRERIDGTIAREVLPRLLGA
jgi:hypothetical protein